MSNGLAGNAFTRNIWFDLYPRSRSHEASPSTSCDLCTCKVGSCYGQWLRKCITKKIHYLTLTPRSRGSRSHKMLLSTLGILCLMNQQSLMLLHPMVKEKMHLQENTLFDLDPKVKVTTKYCLVPSTSCDLCVSKVWYCYIPRLRRRWIYKKIHYWPLGQGHRKFYIKWPMHLHSLKLLRQKV